MFFHKYKTEVGTVFLVSGKRNPGKLTLILPSTGKETISGESVKNFLSNIESKFKEEPLPEEPEEKKPEKEAPTEEVPEKKKKALATIIRQYALTLKD